MLPYQTFFWTYFFLWIENVPHMIRRGLAFSNALGAFSNALERALRRQLGGAVAP